MKSWFRGDKDADVTLFDLVNAYEVGQLDGLLIGKMRVKQFKVHTDNVHGFKDLALLCEIAAECKDEKQLSDLFKDCANES